MINWANIIDDQIINIEPVVAEIRMFAHLFAYEIMWFVFFLAADATCQFTLILTGIKIGPVKIDVPFKLDGIDDYGYFHVEAEIIVRILVMISVSTVTDSLGSECRNRSNNN